MSWLIIIIVNSLFPNSISTKLFADSLSKADVPSSIKSIFLPLNNALAIANLWRCPPERFFP